MILYYIFGSLSPLISIVVLVLLIRAIFSNRSISRRLSIIESKLKEEKGTGTLERKSESINATMIQPVGFSSLKEEQNSVVQAINNNSNVRPQVEVPNKFTNWLKEDWLMKLGAFLFIVGFGWFVSYAFANNWIGPVGRISIGIVAGMIIMALGFWRMMRYPSQGALFMALGAGMAMLTIFAGRSIYGFFTPALAVGFDFIIAAFVSFASYKFNVKSLALTAQVLAFVTPLLSAGQTDSVFLFSYLFFVSLATLLLASVTGWRHLISTSLIFVGLYSFPYIISSGLYGGGSYQNDAPVILNFAYLFSMLYLLAGMFAVVKKGVQDSKNEIFLAVLNGLFLFMWIHNVALAEWRVMIFAVWAIIFSVSSFVAFYFSSKLEPFYSYGSVAVAFIAAATAAQLQGASLTIAFTIEVLLLVVIVFALTKNIRATITTSWLFVAPLFLSMLSLAGYANSRELFTKDFFVLTLLALALIIAGRVITHFGKVEQEGTKATSGSVLVIFGILYIGYILWQFIHILMIGVPDMATMATLLLYTIFGLIAYFAGLYGNDMARKTYGIALLAFVVIRLILVDVWDMALFGRVITFLAIGVLLMSTAFLTKKKKNE